MPEEGACAWASLHEELVEKLEPWLGSRAEIGRFFADLLSPARFEGLRLREARADDDAGGRKPI
eukprot:1154568-Prymnesium_polylepis.1